MNSFHLSNNFKTMRFIKYISFLLIPISLFSCKKLVEVGIPNTSISQENAYAEDGNAIPVLTNLYADMSNTALTTQGNINSMSVIGGLSADELTLLTPITVITTTGIHLYYSNTLATDLTIAGTNAPWSKIYPKVYVTNAALEGLAASNTLSPAVKKQLQGEAKFMRAFYYFYLVNLYGDVPLVLTTDWRINEKIPRSSKAEVWKQIIADLTDAKALLSSSYLDITLTKITTERVRPTSWAATAMLARAYLYTGEYAKAETEASLIINNTSQFSTATLAGAFLKNSTEAIWQLQPVVAGRNTQDAWYYILPATGPSVVYPVYLSAQQLAAFEPGDLRKTNWISSVTVAGRTYYFPYKYKSATLNAAVTEYAMVLRLSEQYLIRAEARIQQDNVAGGITDLNIVRDRGTNKTLLITDSNRLPVLSATLHKGTALTAVLHERQTELFTEWGHRWFDLKRTGNIDVVMNVVSPLKGGFWDTAWQLLPIPVLEVESNPGLKGHQNPGY